MPRLARWKFYILFLFSAGCSGWSRVPGEIPRQPAQFKLFEVWSGDQRLLWRALRAEGDSVSGIPSAESIECSQCRIGVAIADVNSVRAGGTDKSSSTGFAVVSGGVTMYVLLLLAALGTSLAGGT